MTTDEARYVWAHRDEYDSSAVDYAVDVLEQAGEL